MKRAEQQVERKGFLLLFKPTFFYVFMKIFTLTFYSRKNKQFNLETSKTDNKNRLLLLLENPTGDHVNIKSNKRGYKIIK